MKIWMKYLTIICCLAGSAVLAWFDKPGWGWFLFLAFCVAGNDCQEKAGC